MVFLKVFKLRLQEFQMERDLRFADFRFFLASLILSFFLIEGFMKNLLRLSSLNNPSFMSWRLSNFNARST